MQSHFLLDGIRHFSPRQCLCNQTRHCGQLNGRRLFLELTLFRRRGQGSRITDSPCSASLSLATPYFLVHEVTLFAVLCHRLAPLLAPIPLANFMRCLLSFSCDIGCCTQSFFSKQHPHPLLFFHYALCILPFLRPLSTHCFIASLSFEPWL